MQKNSKRTSVVGAIVVIVLICLAIEIVGIMALNKYNSQKFSNQLREAFDNVDRDMAISKLNELRGMILEVESLYHKDISQSVLLDELEGITSTKHFTNPYLKDFTFMIPSTSHVGELCEELISQIDDQIHTIKFGTKGE